MLRGTYSERRSIRTYLLSGAGEIRVREGDGIWFAGLAEIAVIEAGSAAELLREIALILEEA